MYKRQFINLFKDKKIPQEKQIFIDSLSIIHYPLFIMKHAYISTHLADAQSAGARFHLNPIILLAQAALESGWGTSRLAREANNHFGITGYGASNAFWHRCV